MHSLRVGFHCSVIFTAVDKADVGKAARKHKS